MSRNVGGIGKILPLLIGSALVVLALTGTIGMWGWIGHCPWPPGYLTSAQRINE